MRAIMFSTKLKSLSSKLDSNDGEFSAVGLSELNTLSLLHCSFLAFQLFLVSVVEGLVSLVVLVFGGMVQYPEAFKKDFLSFWKQIRKKQSPKRHLSLHFSLCHTPKEPFLLNRPATVLCEGL
jgi:hypothetical protein